MPGTIETFRRVPLVLCLTYSRTVTAAATTLSFFTASLSSTVATTVRAISFSHLLIWQQGRELSRWETIHHTLSYLRISTGQNNQTRRLGNVMSSIPTPASFLPAQYLTRNRPVRHRLSVLPFTLANVFFGQNTTTRMFVDNFRAKRGNPLS